MDFKGLNVQGLDPSSLTWTKSSRSGPNCDNCVELADVPGGVALRDSKNPGAEVKFFTNAEMAAFLGGVKDGEFDCFIV